MLLELHITPEADSVFINVLYLLTGFLFGFRRKHA